MSLEVLRGSPRVLKHALPSHLQKVDLEHLQLDRDFANTYFQVKLLKIAFKITDGQHLLASTPQTQELKYGTSTRAK